MASSSTSRVRASALRSPVLSLLKANSIGLKSGEYGGIRGQVQQPRPVFFDRLFPPVDLVHGQIIEHHHIARPQRGAQHLVEAGREDRPVHGPVDAEQYPQPGVSAAISVTFAPPCNGTAWSTRRPWGARP